PEYELIDTGIFTEKRYIDGTLSYAKVDPLVILVRISATKRGPEAAPLHLLPTLWFRNTWAWGYDARRPQLTAVEAKAGKAGKAGKAQDVRFVQVQHYELGENWLACEGTPELLFTENETNDERLWGVPNHSAYVKDGIDETIVYKAEGKVNPEGMGTKVAAHYSMVIEPGATQTILLRLSATQQSKPFAGAEKLFTTRIAEADD